MSIQELTCLCSVIKSFKRFFKFRERERESVYGERMRKIRGERVREREVT